MPGCFSHGCCGRSLPDDEKTLASLGREGSVDLAGDVTRDRPGPSAGFGELADDPHPPTELVRAQDGQADAGHREGGRLGGGSGSE